jgi:hypothetical protein
MSERTVSASTAARLVQALSVLALGLAGAFLVLFVLMGQGFVPETYFLTGLLFLVAVLAPIFALAAVVVAKLCGKPVPRLARAALAAGCAVFLWPLLFFLAFSSCPQGLC